MKSVLVTLVLSLLMTSAHAAGEKRLVFKGEASQGDEAGNGCYIAVVYDSQNKIVDVQASGAVGYSFKNQLLSLSRMMGVGRPSFHRIDREQTIDAILGTLQAEGPRDVPCIGKEEACVYQSPDLLQMVASKEYTLEESGVNRKENFKIILQQGRPVAAEISASTKTTSWIEGGTEVRTLNCSKLQPR